MNLSDERAAAVARREARRKRELAQQILNNCEAGADEKTLTRAAIERWPKLTTDDLVAVINQVRELRKEHPEMARESVTKLREWVREELKKNQDLLSPDCFELAKGAGVVQVAYDTFRTQYFYPVRNEVYEELGIKNPKKQERKKKKRFMTQGAQDRAAQEEKDRAEAAELKAQRVQEEAGSTEVHEEAHQELSTAVQRGRRPRPPLVKNTRSISEVDASSPPPVPPFPDAEESTILKEEDREEFPEQYSPTPEEEATVQEELAETRGSPMEEGLRGLTGAIRNAAGQVVRPGDEIQTELPEEVLTVNVRSPVGTLRYAELKTGAVHLELSSPDRLKFHVIFRFLDELLQGVKVFPEG